MRFSSRVVPQGQIIAVRATTTKTLVAKDNTEEVVILCFYPVIFSKGQTALSLKFSESVEMMSA